MFAELPEKRINLMENTWEILANCPIPLNINHYNAKLRVYGENDHAYSPPEFLADLNKKGIAPNRFVVNSDSKTIDAL